MVDNYEITNKFDNIETVKIVEYKCPVCHGSYNSLEEAKKCAEPINPKYNVGDWVVAKNSLTMAVPGGDWFSRDYDEIKKGSFSRISEVTDANSVFGKDYAHPQIMYRFDEGEWPMRFYALKEEDIGLVTQEDLNQLKDRKELLIKEAGDLDEIIKGCTR